MISSLFANIYTHVHILQKGSYILATHIFGMMVKTSQKIKEIHLKKVLWILWKTNYKC
jgi:hypothetical protein